MACWWSASKGVLPSVLTCTKARELELSLGATPTGRVAVRHGALNEFDDMH
jgi:hypothetical protein